MSMWLNLAKLGPAAYEAVRRDEIVGGRGG
jgi:hypothetical protein